MILNRAVRNARAMMRAGEWGNSHVIPPPSGSGALAGGGENAALSISTVLSCIAALSEDVRALPFNAYSGDRTGPREVLPVQPRIVGEPFGPEVSADEGFGQIVASIGMRGRAYCLVTHVEPRTGLADQLMILHPDAVQTRWVEGGRRHRVGAEDHRSMPTDRAQGSAQVGDVLLLNGLMMPGAAAGVDALTLQRINFQLALDVTSYAQGFFGSGGSPSGVIQHPGAGDRRKAREVLAAWDAGHGGVSNAHRPAVLFGDAKWQPLSVTPENAQFLQTRAYMREEIAGIFNVPLGRIRAKGETYDRAEYAEHALLPLCTTIERAWSRMIPGDAGTWGLFGLDLYLRANPETRAKVAQIHRVIGVRTRDEIRADEGWAPLPDDLGSDPNAPLNSNVSPTGGEDNDPKLGGEPGPTEGGPTA